MDLWIKEYIGIPYESCGRKREGADCWGLVRMILRERFDIEVPMYNEYTDSEDFSSSERVIKDKTESGEWDQVSFENARAGDVVVLRVRGYPIHVGLYLGKGRMIHILRKIKSVVEDLRTPQWKFRVIGYYRYMGGESSD